MKKKLKNILNNLKKEVVVVVKQKDNLFICEECGMGYNDKEISEKCENYCHKNKACNLELVKYAVKLK